MGIIQVRPLRWWIESVPPGWDRAKVSENLGATLVAPVAPADTSLTRVHKTVHLNKHLVLLISSRLYTEQSTLLKCLIHFFLFILINTRHCLLQLGQLPCSSIRKKNTMEVQPAIFGLLSYYIIIYFSKNATYDIVAILDNQNSCQTIYFIEKLCNEILFL